MEIIDRMIQYMDKREKDILIDNDIEISTQDLSVIIINILSWLKLEHKRSIWMSEGKRTSFKPLDIHENYSWCNNLRMLVEKEKLFSDYFAIKDDKFDFADSIREQDRILARQKVYNNYNPVRHV